ncbi:hypothetical protein D9619_009451 [Psilocybe cf. subviscida]|uniref:Glycosyltransferase family 15 protein n=1 Tax=Psilocybe cf. subviscida TaxID=2480587 RepID=A0A8H5BU38_9AGAR|nr:hypothetical protein D9619_009451 [Psilocybe cf. subviscida]
MRSFSSISIRTAFLALCLVFSLHLIATFVYDDYARITSIRRILASKVYDSEGEDLAQLLAEFDDDPRIKAGSHKSPLANVTLNSIPYHPNEQIYTQKRENATFVILCRNDQLWDAVKSVREIEDRFNRRYHYPYVFLNEVPFTEEFKYLLQNIVSSKAEFGLIPHDHWFQPDWIDEERAAAGRTKMVADDIIYGGSVSYRNMCRFNSGFFFRHPLMLKYKWYWRIEPDVHFHCDILFDPFRFMEEHNKIYGFTISMVEYEATIATLWGHVKKFIADHPQYVAKDNAMGFISDDSTGSSYNLCHFWSNFEVGNMEFWRGEAYMKFFEYLDSQGGFYYERWGDAPVHSIAAALFANKDQIHFFDEIGYEHAPYTHCPKAADHFEKGRCTCNPGNNVDWDGISCHNKYIGFMQMKAV